MGQENQLLTAENGKLKKEVEQVQKSANLKSSAIEELGKVVKDLQTQLDKKTVLGKRGYDDFMDFGGELDGHDKRFVMFSDNP